MDKVRTPERRKPLKSRTPTGAWKDRFRQNCLQRLKEKRNSKMNNLRQMDESPQSSQEFVNEVMLGEWDRLKLESPLLSSYPKCQYSEAFDTFCFGADDEFENVDDVLIIFDDLQKELLREEQRLLRQYEDAAEFDEQSMCASIEMMNTESLPCPICLQDNLHQNQQIIFCSCGLRIDTENDAIDLKYVRNQLEEATTTHSNHCRSEPQFGVLDFTGGNMVNLMMSCQSCDYMSVII